MLVDLNLCKIIELPRVNDPRGNLSFIEEGNHIPFTIARTYWVYDVPGGQQRGGHAYLMLKEFIVALSGSFNVTVDNGVEQKTYRMNRSYYGLFIPEMIWRTLDDFSTNAFCLVLASAPYDPDDYIREYNRFKQITSSNAIG